jgi:thymidylate synthase
MDLKKNNLDFDYQSLLHDIMSNGVEKETRNGTTISVFGRQIRHNMSDGFPLLTTKKMAWKQIVIELLWFLRGDTNIKYLHTPHTDVDCNIWDGDAYKNYCKHFMDEYLEKNELGESYRNSLRPYPIEEFINKIKTDNEFAKKWGELGPIYGAQWRNWLNIPGAENKGGKDQIANLISELRTNPDSRRLMVSAWNVGELDQMVLPPCHYGFQVYTRELSHDERFEIYKKVCGRDLQPHITGINFKQFHFDEFNVPTRAISLMWNQRSVDTFLGLPFNIASYGLLLHILAEMTNMVPDELIGNLGDVHLYKNHTIQAIEQISRKPYTLPNLRINTGFWNPENILGDDYGSIIEGLEMNDFQIENYQSHPSIKAPLSN